MTDNDKKRVASIIKRLPSEELLPLDYAISQLINKTKPWTLVEEEITEMTAEKLLYSVRCRRCGRQSPPVSSTTFLPPGWRAVVTAGKDAQVVEFECSESERERLRNNT